MSIYKINDMGELIKDNTYVGRGIVIGKTADGKKAATAYFIMGRSENSRNRVFVEKGDEVIIYPFDESKVEDKDNENNNQEEEKKKQEENKTQENNGNNNNEKQATVVQNNGEQQFEEKEEQ